MEITAQTAERLHIKLYDPNNQRWEVPPRLVWQINALRTGRKPQVNSRPGHEWNPWRQVFQATEQPVLVLVYCLEDSASWVQFVVSWAASVGIRVLPGRLSIVGSNCGKGWRFTCGLPSCCSQRICIFIYINFRTWKLCSIGLPLNRNSVLCSVYTNSSTVHFTMVLYAWCLLNIFDAFTILLWCFNFCGRFSGLPEDPSTPPASMIYAYSFPNPGEPFYFEVSRLSNGESIFKTSPTTSKKKEHLKEYFANCVSFFCFFFSKTLNVSGICRSVSPVGDFPSWQPLSLRSWGSCDPDFEAKVRLWVGAI